MPGKKSLDKGKRGEREWVRRLDKLWPDLAPFARDWLHTENKQYRGDIVTTVEEHISSAYIEAKNRREVTNKMIHDWWESAFLCARAINRMRVLLCVHQTNGPWLIFTNVPDWSAKWQVKRADVIVVPM